jgi:hypothetical protein
MLLALAITDKALFGYNSLDALLEQKIPLGQDELPLRFNDDALDRFIFRRWTLADGITEDKMPKSAFWDMFRRTMRKAGYLCGTSMHSIRRQLGKKVDGKLPTAQRYHKLIASVPLWFCRTIPIIMG